MNLGPWGNPIEYEWLDGPEVLFELTSLGPNPAAGEDDLQLSDLTASSQWARRSYIDNLLQQYEDFRLEDEDPEESRDSG